MSTVRPATSADLAAIVASEAAAFPLDAWSENLVREGVAGMLPTIAYLVLEDDQDDQDGRDIAGHAVVSVAAEDAELQRIAVAPDRRGRGLGRRLLAACLVDAASRGAERVVLEVREDNAAALALYAGAGFVEIARRQRYYRDGSTAVVLERSVRMEP